MNRGFSHVGLATHDMDATIDFYVGTLGFRIVRYDRTLYEEGGACRHIFFDLGAGQLLSFLEPKGVPTCAEGFDAGINRGLGVPRSMYHFAFEAGDEEGLEAVRDKVDAAGIEVSKVIDHDWCKSIYFFDPVNGLSLEYCFLAREFVEDDWTLQTRKTTSVQGLDLDLAALAQLERDKHAALAEKAAR